MFVLSILISVLFGFVLVFSSWPNQKPFYHAHLMRISIAGGLGFGISSVIFFLWLLVAGPNRNFFMFEGFILIFLIAVFFYYFIRNRKFAPVSETYQEAHQRFISRNLSIVFCILFLLACMTFISALLKSPHGGWDAWAIWNMKARFMFRSGEYWKGVLSSWYAHPDYPLFVPLTVARIWKAIGHETVIVPSALAMLFTFSTILLTFSSLAILRSKSQGLLAGLVLLGTPSYIREGALQLSDHPLGFFFLSTFVLFALHDHSFTQNHKMLLYLAGMTAGFSAWTKNEGFLFLIAIVMARSFVIIPIKGLRIFLHQISIFLLGLMPVLLMILYFKIVIAPTGDMASLQNLSKAFLKLAESSRYLQTTKVFLKTSMEFTRGIIGIPLFILYLYLMGMSEEKRCRVSASTTGMALSLMLIGYFFAFIVTPYDLDWHLTSSPRLFLQLWPSFVFYFFMVVHRPEQVILKKGCDSDSKTIDLRQ